MFSHLLEQESLNKNPWSKNVTLLIPAGYLAVDLV